MFTTLRASAHNIPLPDSSVHLIVTSPPYMNLRSYAGEQMVEFPTVFYAPMAGLPPIEIPAVVCGLGQEPTVEAYIGHLILCLRNWKNLLRMDGTAWINLGDSYSGSGGSGGDYSPGGLKEGQPKTKGAKANGIPAKNLLLVPERFRLAAQADGWIVRSAFPWVKRNCLPESVTDRAANSLESWVMLAKSPRYYWDAESIKAEAAQSSIDRINQPNFDNQTGGEKDYGNGTNPNRSARKTLENFAKNPGRNRRTGDWLFESLDAAIADTRRWLAHAEQVKANQGLLLDTDGDPLAMLVNPRPFPGQHFACFPQGVVEPLILGGTSQHGCCSKCGNPWRRVVEKGDLVSSGPNEIAVKPRSQNRQDETLPLESRPIDGYGDLAKRERITTGWEPSCQCVGAEIIPATVLDPFVGSGTTLEVATSLGRHSIGVDISQEYLDNVLPIRFADGVQIGMQF